MADIFTPSHPLDPEAEPVLVDVEHGEVTLTLDDGTAVVVGESELRDALERDRKAA